MISPVTEKEPIAITGMGMNFPGGARSVASFWKLMCDGTDAITEIPEDRWDISRFYHEQTGQNSRSYSKWGGFIDDVEQFDATFFGLSATEAKGMDPQQRLMLEVAWHALEDAGEVITRQQPEPIGVFAGVCTSEHKNVRYTISEPMEVTPYTATGGAISIVPNRISHLLNLSGPSVAFDTACSSSLVALHYGCHSLWNGECDRALVGGVNYITDPVTWVAFCGMGALSADGHCKAFDASADGFVRAEGAGAVLLKPLSRAIADGDRIYACIRETGINQDGHTPAISMPDRSAQEQLIERTLDGAGVRPTDIRYVEAHGTGTPIGDPIEANAIGNVLGKSRSKDNPLLMGSVKTNIGHLEAGAGIAGLIKSALVLSHRQVPANLHFQDPNPEIPWADLNVEVPTKRTSLTPHNGTDKIYTSINSFGFGGTNAHAVLESANLPQQATSPAPGSHCFAFSAQSENALKNVVSATLDTLPLEDPAAYHRMAVSSLLHRTPLKHRLLICSQDATTTRRISQNWLNDKPDANAVSATDTAPENSGIVFVFNGQGSQWFQMGRELMRHHPASRALMESIRDEILKLGGFDLIEELARSEEDSSIQQTQIAQPAIFAVQVALAQWWRDHGVEPAAVVGHSVGEVAAAHIAGMLTLEQAARVIYHRGDTMQHAGGGKMLAVGITPTEAETLLEPYGDRVALAAANSPNSVSISGEPAALTELSKIFEEREVFCREVPVEYAFHSAQMNPVQQPLLQALDGLAPGAPHLPLYSTVTGSLVTDERWDADYWWHNVRETVRFADAIARILEDSYSGFLELGSHPVLRPSLTQCAKEAGRDRVVVTYSQHKKEPSADSLFHALATLDGSGYDVRRDRWVTGCATKSELPLYPFDAERYWDDFRLWGASRLDAQPHPYLVSPTQHIDPAWLFYPRPKLYPYFVDHAFENKVLIPAAAFIEMGLAIGTSEMDTTRLLIEDMEFRQALLLPEGRQTPAVRISLQQPTSSLLQIHSCTATDFGEWTLHAEAEMRVPARTSRFDADTFNLAKLRCTREVETEIIYKLFQECGLQYGPTFQGIQHIRAGELEVFAEVQLSSEDLWHENYLLHPALLDAAFQCAIAAIPEELNSRRGAYLPSFVRRIRFECPAGKSVKVHVQLKRLTDQELEADYTLVNEEGELVAHIEGFQCTRVETASSQYPNGLETHSYTTHWHLSTPASCDDTTPPARFFPDIRQVAADADKTAKEQGLVLASQDAETMLLQLEAVTLAYIIKALIDLGFDPAPGDTFTATELQQKSGVIPAHHRQLRQFLRYLEQAGTLQAEGDGAWRVLQRLNVNALDTAYPDAQRQLPAMAPELNLLVAMGEVQAQVMRGELNALEVLFSTENNTLLERLYSNAYWSITLQSSVAEAMRHLTRTLPVGRKLRILEIGGGTGATTAAYLPSLPAGRYEVTFTDISEAFFHKAEQRFQEYPDIRYRKLDISQSPDSQEFGADYDIVVCANVIHATPLLQPAVEHVRSLLRPGGVLLLPECIRQNLNLMDVIFGLTPDWWGYQDADFRGDYPNLSLDGWKKLLADAGFEPVQLAQATDDPNDYTYGLFLAQLPDEKTSPAATPDTAAPFSEEQWILVGHPEHMLSRQVKAEFEKQGQDCHVLHPETAASDWDKVARLAITDKTSGVLVLHTTDGADWSDEMSTEDWKARLDISLYPHIDWLKALSAQESETMPLTAFVTCGALSVLPEEVPQAVPSMLHAMARVASNELRQIGLQLYDLSATPHTAEIQQLVQSLIRLDPESARVENQIAFRQEGRYLPRLEPAPPHTAPPELATPLHDDAYRITSSQFGALDRLHIVTASRRAPATDEVEVRVHAAGLNFRDVMKALNIYPTTIGDARLLGDEFCGEIVATGKGVTRFQPGDRVIGIDMGSFRSYWTGHASSLCHLPDSYTYTEGATLLTAYTTAQHALHQVGRIQPGERILIHSGAGGVGLAAIRIAQHAGAEVFATAGSQMKRALLRRLGVPHVFDSRSLEFADEIMEATQGEGIDLVLNSLAGAAIPKSLDCLRQGGRFMEIGKRDIYGNSRIGLRPFRNGLSFTSIDLAMGMDPDDPILANRMQEIETLLEQDVIRPLPHTIFPFREPAAAFRYMSQGRHVGKIVLNLSGEAARGCPRFIEAPPHFSDQRTALITGGTKGMGLALARQLVERGCRHLMLLSRSGLTTEPANEPLHRLLQDAKSVGAQVEVRAVDVSDADAVAAVCRECRKILPPLGTVIHSAFVLADALFTDMTRQDWETALHIKALGAWNLHRSTQEDELDHFIVLSSVASIFGSPGQANYVAANTFVEDLVAYRRACGKAGTSVQLDKINDTGSITRDDELEAFLTRMGWEGVTSEQAIQSILALTANDVPNGAAIRTDLSAVISTRPVFKEQNRFSKLPEHIAADASGQQGQLLRQTIIAAAPADRLEPAADFLAEQVARVLRVSPASLSRAEPLAEQGVDSLMAVELIGILESQLSITIPTGKIVSAPTVNSLAAIIVETLTGEKVVSSSTQADPSTRIDLTEEQDYPALDLEATPETDLEQLRAFLQEQAATYSSPSHQKHILLTGANGFLGTYLLREWLQHTDLHITCLVRADSESAARDRIHSAWQHYQLDTDWLNQHAARWHVICGELAKPRLGMNPETFQRLGESIDTIFHSGAVVNHVAAYHTLRSANVLGTLELLKLAGIGRPKRFHFASSVAVYDRKPTRKCEADLPDALPDILAGYGQTKAVCEHLLEDACKNGLPLTIHRIGPVIGDRVSAITAEHDIIWTLLKISAQIGLAAQNDGALGLIPVDLASRIITTALVKEHPPHRLHIMNPEHVSFDGLIAALQRQGVPIQITSNAKWLAKAKRSEHFDSIASYALFRPEIFKDLLQGFQFPEIGLEVMTQVMQEADIEAEPMDEATLDFYARYLLRTELSTLPRTGNHR